MGSTITGIIQGLSGLGTSIAQDVAISSGPQLIPGTSSVYLPSTGQVVNTGSNSALLLFGVLALAGIVLFVALRK